jgi:hypothetical protein
VKIVWGLWRHAGLNLRDVFPVCFDVEGDNGGPALDALKAKIQRFKAS